MQKNTYGEFNMYIHLLDTYNASGRIYRKILHWFPLGEDFLGNRNRRKTSHNTKINKKCVRYRD